MATESDRKRFNLEQIIEHISEESSLMNSGSFRPILVSNYIPDQVERMDLLENRQQSPGTLDESSSSDHSDDTSADEDTFNERIDADESTMPTKISPRCDVCRLLHFKSYRCLTRFTAPSYLRRLFDETTEKIRVCRKCLTSKENCVENVAISSLASYSSQIRQMKIPLGMTSERRTRAFEFVVRDLKHLKNGRRPRDDLFDPPTPVPWTLQHKTMLQRFNVDDPFEKNLFLKELNLYSTDIMKNMSQSSDSDVQDECDSPTTNQISNDVPVQAIPNEASPKPKANEKPVYHVAAKDVPSTNVSEKKIGHEMFDARRGMNHNLVVHTKRAWKPNKKYDDLRKVERTNLKKEGKRAPKQVKPKAEKGDKSDHPDKIRTCGINCAVCLKHVQKSYSCCTLQTAPEKYKHIFTPGVIRLKICRKCIPYKKVAGKVENGQNVLKKKIKMKQIKKRGRKPKSVQPAGPIVKAISFDGEHFDPMENTSLHRAPVSMDDGMFTVEPLAPVMATKEKVSNNRENMDISQINEHVQFFNPYDYPIN